MSSETSQLEPVWVAGALAEYEAHRAEVLTEVQGQQQTLALGATAVGVLAAGGFNVWDDRLLATVAFLAAGPLLSILILIQWAGRSFGLMRVGVYLEALENALRSVYAAPSPILTWEATLARARPRRWWAPHAGWHDAGAIAVFVLLATGSVALGAYRGYAGHETLIVATAAIELLALLLFTSAIGWNLATVRQRARADFPRPDRGSA